MGETILRMCSASAEACLKGKVFLFSLSGTAVKSNRRRTAGVLIANPDSFHSISPNLVDDRGAGGGVGTKGGLLNYSAKGASCTRPLPGPPRTHQKMSLM